MQPSIPSTSITKFFMATVPVGWTQITSGVDDCILRVTTGTVGSGGSTPFSSAFVSKTASGTRSLTIASDNSISSAAGHSHNSSARLSSGPASRAAGPTYSKPPTLPAPTQSLYTWPGPTFGPTGASTNPAGGGQGHTHSISTPASLNGPVTGATRNFAINYVDVILGQRN